jgi:hypothetical protein
MGIDARITRLERQHEEAGTLPEREAMDLLLGAMRHAGRQPEAEAAHGPDLAAIVRGTRAGAFLAALRQFGAEGRARP